MATSLPDRNETAKPKFLEQVRIILRTRHYSLRTEEAYLGWIRRFVLFHGKRHPQEMGGTDVAAFLSYLAGERAVADATRNQALNALLFDSFAPGSVGLSACPSDSRLPSPLGSLQGGAQGRDRLAGGSRADNKAQTPSRGFASR